MKEITDGGGKKIFDQTIGINIRGSIRSNTLNANTGEDLPIDGTTLRKCRTIYFKRN